MNWQMAQTTYYIHSWIYMSFVYYSVKVNWSYYHHRTKFVYLFIIVSHSDRIDSCVVTSDSCMRWINKSSIYCNRCCCCCVLANQTNSNSIGYFGSFPLHLIRITFCSRSSIAYTHTHSRTWVNWIRNQVSERFRHIDTTSTHTHTYTAKQRRQKNVCHAMK